MNEILPVFVGLDYHQDSVQVCVLDPDGAQLLNRSLDNNWQTITKAVRPLGTVKRAGIECCTGAADLAQELADRAGWTVQLGHPGYVSRMKQSPDKSDYSDGRMLADLVRVGYLPKVWLAPEPIRELRQVVRHRQRLVQQRRAAKQQVNAILRQQRIKCPLDCARWSKRWTTWLEAVAPLSQAGRWVVGRLSDQLKYVCSQIELTEKQLEQMTCDDPVIGKLKTLPGVGDVTAWVIRAAIGRFDRFATGKQLAKYCGLSPRNASSGNRQADAGLIKTGEPYLRSTLIEAAHRLVRTHRRWRELALKLQSAGKNPCLIAAAVANRWVRWMFHQVQGVAG